MEHSVRYILICQEAGALVLDLEGAYNNMQSDVAIVTSTVELYACIVEC